MHSSVSCGKELRDHGTRKISLEDWNRPVISVHVPKSWVKELEKLETLELKQAGVVRSALWNVPEVQGRFPR